MEEEWWKLEVNKGKYTKEETTVNICTDYERLAREKWTEGNRNGAVREAH